MALLSGLYTLWTLLLCIVLPPLGVLMRTGVNKDLLINILLTILGYVPGIIHAIYLLFRAPSIGAGHKEL